jgi:hypothetical protein
MTKKSSGRRDTDHKKGMEDTATDRMEKSRKHEEKMKKHASKHMKGHK